MLKSIVAVTVLATVAAIVFGLGGVLSNAMNNGMSHIANIITNASWGRGSDAAKPAGQRPEAPEADRSRARRASVEPKAPPQDAAENGWPITLTTCARF